MAEDIKMERPDWDTYFMEIANVVARRSNCSRRHVAAVIVKDKRIISTGYNGTPRGLKNCHEGGCPRCSSNAPSGSHLGECLCSHGEENAIVSAAYHGVSVKDATLYSWAWTEHSPPIRKTINIQYFNIRITIQNIALLFRREVYFAQINAFYSKQKNIMRD